MRTRYLLDGKIIYEQLEFHAPVNEGDTVEIKGIHYIIIDKMYSPETDIIENQMELL